MADELYGKDEVVANEKVDATSLEGDFIGVIGKTYKREGKKRTSTVTDIILVQQVNAEGAVTRKIMDIAKSPDGHFELRFIEKEGKKQTFGVIIGNSMADPVAEDPDGTKNFFANNKRIFARALGCYNEATQTVMWDKIQAAVGTAISFTLEERGGFSNVAPKSVTVYPGVIIPISSVVNVYKTLEAEKMAREAAKAGGAPAPAKVDDPF